MRKKQFDPFKNLKLDSYEQEIEDSIDPDKVHIMNDAERKRYASYAKYTLDLEKKEARLNIRLKKSDLEIIREKAQKSGLPYQTLISALLHQFASGRIKILL